MKRRELIRQLNGAGCQLLRAGSRHDIYWNPANGRRQPVPRHSEIDEHLVRHIKRYLALASRFVGGVVRPARQQAQSQPQPQSPSQPQAPSPEAPAQSTAQPAPVAQPQPQPAA